MTTFFNPIQMMSLSIQTSMMMAEAQMVIAMRLWGMAGLWNTAPGEVSRMVREKQSAGIASAMAAGRAVSAGKNAGDIAMAAMKPVRARTRSNVSRLARRGPAA
jgi:hypothetical protein